MRGTARSRRARRLRKRQPRCGPAPPQPDRGQPPLVARHSWSRGPCPLSRHQARSPSRPGGSHIPCGCTGRVARQGVPYGSATGPGGVIRPRLPQATRPPTRRAPALAIAGQTRPRIPALPDLPPQRCVNAGRGIGQTGFPSLSALRGLSAHPASTRVPIMERQGPPFPSQSTATCARHSDSVHHGQDRPAPPTCPGPSGQVPAATSSRTRAAGRPSSHAT